MPKQFTRHGAIRLVIQGRASHGDIDNLVPVIPVEAIDEVSADLGKRQSASLLSQAWVRFPIS